MDPKTAADRLDQYLTAQIENREAEQLRLEGELTALITIRTTLRQFKAQE